MSNATRINNFVLISVPMKKKHNEIYAARTRRPELFSCYSSERRQTGNTLSIKGTFVECKYASLIAADSMIRCRPNGRRKFIDSGRDAVTQLHDSFDVDVLHRFLGKFDTPVCQLF